MQLQLKAAEELNKKTTEMITAVATTLGRVGPPLQPPVITLVNDRTIGSGINQLTYSGSWADFNKTGLNEGNGRFSNENNAYVQLRFWGFKAEVITEKWENHGKVAISVDGGSETLVDLYSALTTDLQAVRFSTGDLTEGEHTIKIRVTDQKNALASNTYYVHDLIKVYATDAYTPPPVTDLYDWYIQQDYIGVSTGTEAQPYTTISAVNSLAQTGDRVAIKSGTYRESPAPANNGVTYLAFPGHTVYVSGLELVGNSGWTVHSGNIYKKTITLPMANNFSATTSGNNTILLANQVFKDGEMMHLARWPKVSTAEDFLDKPNKMRKRADTSVYSDTQITDTGFGALGIATNALSGAALFTNGWFLSETRTLTGNNGNTFTYGSGTINGDAYRKFYYITNNLNLLTDEKEWYYSSGTLYFRQPGGGSPTGVEYKVRNWGFDLRGRSGTVITGINFIGCEPYVANVSTTGSTMDNCKIRYQNHAFLTPNASPEYFYNARQVGITHDGVNNVIRNCEFRYGIQGIWAGSNTKVLNCYFYNYGYDGTYASPIAFRQGANGVEIGYNTITRCGRSNIHMGSYITGNQTQNTFLNLNIHHNDMSYHSMLVNDNGAIYSNIRTELSGTVISYNWMHHNALTRVGGVDGVQVTGIYMDQSSGPITEHHNITWAGDECDFYAEQHAPVDNGWTPPAPARTVTHNHYNNTYAGTTDRTYISYSGVADTMKNCIYLGNISGALNVSNSISKATNPLFVGGSLTSPQNYFQLQSGSPARGIAASLPGINDEDTSPKDSGAYPYQQAPWLAGYTSVPYNP